MPIAIAWFIVTLLISGCAQRRQAPQPAPEAPAREAPAREAPARAALALAPPVARSTASSLDAYKVEVAQRIHAASPDIASGRPQDLLRAVIVLRVVLSSAGQPLRVTIQRSPGDAEAEQRAIQSVRRAAPYPRPSNAVLRGRGSIEFSETWLFNDDGRFQLRSLAQTQAGG